MKMASTSAFTLFLLWCSVVASQDCDQFAATGQSFNVPLGYALKNTDTLKWRLNNTIIFSKRKGVVNVGRKNDINADGSLKGTNVRKDQAGLYSAEVYDESGREQTRKSIKLCVLDPVKKPKVGTTCEGENVTVKCIPGEQPVGVEYGWLQNGAKMEKEKRLSFQVKAAESESDKFACKVSNKASFEVSEPVAHNCVKTGELTGTNWIFIGVGVGFVLVLIIIMCRR